MPMGNDARTKWNAARYTQVKIHAEPELAAAFKSVCAARGVSMASVLSEAMAAYSGKALRHADISELDYSTRGRRRTAVKQTIGQLEAVRDAEAEYRDNIPENLRGGIRHEMAEEAVSLLEAAINALAEVF